MIQYILSYIVRREDGEAWSAAAPGVGNSRGRDLATEQHNKYSSEKCYKINEIR